MGSPNDLPHGSAIRCGRPIRELVLARGLLDAAKLDRILSPAAMTKGGVVE